MSAAVAFAVATTAAAQQANAPSTPQLSLERFDAKYGFPTFPQSTPNFHHAVRVPIIFNGANLDALRINDVTKIPVINHDTPPGEVRR